MDIMKDVTEHGGIFDFTSIPAFGYIPLVGIPLGIVRLMDPKAWSTINDWDLLHTMGHVTRGIIETVSLGFLLIIPDLIMTFGRMLCC